MTTMEEEFTKAEKALEEKETSIKLAEEHVEWFLDVIKPLLISHFIYGYKHGKEGV